VPAVQRRATRLRDAGAALAEKVRRVYARARPSRDPADVDAGLYDGFVGDGDKRRFSDVRATAPHMLGSSDFCFTDQRLPELLFRYRARNWPQSLTVDERARWDDYRRRRLLTESDLSEMSLERYRLELQQLRSMHAGDGGKLALLDRLDAWSRDIEAGLQ